MGVIIGIGISIAIAVIAVYVLQISPMALTKSNDASNAITTFHRVLLNL